MSNNSYLLILETASSKPALFLARNQELIEAVHFSENGQLLSENLFSSLDQLLIKNRVKAQDLSLISCGVGPGSYTGMRVGAIVAKSFGYALDIPLVGYCSLMAYIPPHEGPFISLFDARSPGVYLIEGEKKGDRIDYTTSPKRIPFEAFLEKIPSCEQIVTPDRERIKERLGDRWQNFEKKVFV